jgi:GTPase SAR1 family protein
VTVHERASRAFADAIDLAGDGGLDRLLGTLAEAQAGLAAPMRVAVVGRIKAGKSTLMNALLGQSVAPTGQEELTFNVNWFVYADPPRVTVHFIDGRPPESRALSDLGKVVSRTSDHADLLTSIAHVEVGLPRGSTHPGSGRSSRRIPATPSRSSAWNQIMWTA